MPLKICGRCAAAGLQPSQRQLSVQKSWSFVSDLRHQKYFSAFRAGHEFVHNQNNKIPRRYASSSSSSSSRKTKKPLKVESSILPDVNPPASTRPPELNLPTRPPDIVPFSQKASWVFSIGRAYLAFYKAGMKNVYRNYKASLGLRSATGLPRYLPTSLPPPRGRHGPSSAALVAQLDSLKISRADFQLMRRSAHDIRRMIPFALVMLVFGEFTPIAVIAFGNAVTPLACRLPNQNRNTREKRFELKRQALQATQADLGSATPIASGSNEEMTWLAQNFGSRELAVSKNASAQIVLRGCAVFGLVKSLRRVSLLVPLIYRPRLIRHVEYLELDDKMLLQGGGVEALNAEEVRIAVEERGGVFFEDSNPSPAHTEARDREWLTRWFAARKGMLGGHD